MFGFEPLRKNRRKCLEELLQWNGQPLPPRLMTELVRELDRLELVMSQLAELEAERDRALQARRTAFTNATKAPSSGPTSAGEVGSQLLRLRSIGPEIASVAGSVLPQLQQPAGSGCLFGAYTKPLEERWHRRRARHFEGGKRALANHHDSACLVVGASSARQCSEPMVPRKGRRQTR